MQDKLQKEKVRLIALKKIKEFEKTRIKKGFQKEFNKAKKSFKQVYEQTKSNKDLKKK